MKHFIKLFLTRLETVKISSSWDLEKLKDKVSAGFHVSPPSNADLRKAYLEGLAKGWFGKSLAAEKWLCAKRMRTASGVATVAVLTKDFPCKGNCLYCPTEKLMPKSYLSNEPAVMRAVTVNFDPYQQVQKRLEALELNGHPVSKIEIIVMGGTFSHLPMEYRYNFVKECFRACNEYELGARDKGNFQFSIFNFQTISNDVIFNKEALFLEQTKNEMAAVRVVGLTLETRPDEINEEEIRIFRELGATRVEIGVQSVDEQVLKINRRGHGVKATVEATRLLKDAGFKVSYHMMLGLPGSTPKKDYESLKKIFEDERFRPDLVKIYPCAVTENSELFALWQSGQYKPLSNKENEKLIIKIKKIIPYWVRVSRIIRDIPSTSIVAGPDISNLRQLVAEKVECQCIRCREVGKTEFSLEEAILRRTDYSASRGKEIFLEYVSGDGKKLFSLLRLRLPGKESISGLSELKGAALIREVHTYGRLVGLGEKSVGKTQHFGLGKRLLLEAEKIVRAESNCKKIAVISGVGVREYYAKQGYKLQGTYMTMRIPKIE